jgi:hypothetical protein
LTDLGRSRLSEKLDVENSIFKIWLSTLLDDIEDVEARPIGAPDVPDDLFRRAKWLENYNALELYRVARTAWPYCFDDRLKALKLLENWEKGEGPSLWCGDSYSTRLCVTIFDLILPKVTSIVVGANANYYVHPPSDGWRETLRTWNKFIVDNLRWPRFATYTSDVQNDLYDVYSSDNFLNKKYEDRFHSFELPEIESLPKLLENLSSARDRGTQAKFIDSEIALLNKLVDLAGDLTINRFGMRRTVRDLVKGGRQRTKH